MKVKHMSKKIIDWLAIVITLIILSLIITSCTKERTVTEIENHINNTIVVYCDLYRSSESLTQQTIKRRVSALVENYYGRVHVDAEYCLNSMEVPFNGTGAAVAAP